MPRVYMSESERLNDRLVTWIIGTMKMKGITQKILAEEMMVSQQALSVKLKRRRLSFTDFLAAVKVLDPDIEEIAWLVGKGRT